MTRTLLGLWFLLQLGGASAHAQPSIDGAILLRRGMVRLAWRAILDEQAVRPDDPDLQVQLGLSLARMGAWRDAVDTFSLGGDSGPLYDDGPGLRAHADALREVGRPRAAASLREEALQLLAESGRLALYQGLISDYRAAGDFAAAREASQRGLSEFPYAASLMAQRATVELDAGDRATAEAWLDLADLRQPAHVRQSLLLRARLALTDGQPEEAKALLQTLRKRNLRDLDALPLLMAIEAAAEDPRAALDAWNAPAWGHVDHPAARCQAVLAHLALGERAQARTLASDLQLRYPLRSDVQALKVLFQQLGW